VRTAPYYVRAVVLTQYRPCDGRTDGIAEASTALAMRALRRAVKNVTQHSYGMFTLESET